MDLASGVVSGVPTSRKYSQVESEESDHRALFQNPACGLTQFKLRIILILSVVHSSLTNPRIYNLCCEVPLILRPTWRFPLDILVLKICSNLPSKMFAYARQGMRFTSFMLLRGMRSHLQHADWTLRNEGPSLPETYMFGRNAVQILRLQVSAWNDGLSTCGWGSKHINSILFILLGRMAWAGDQVESAM